VTKYILKQCLRHVLHMVITAANFGYLSGRGFQYFCLLNLSHDDKNIFLTERNIFFKQSKNSLQFCFAVV